MHVSAIDQSLIHYNGIQVAIPFRFIHNASHPSHPHPLSTTIGWNAALFSPYVDDGRMDGRDPIVKQAWNGPCWKRISVPLLLFPLILLLATNPADSSVVPFMEQWVVRQGDGTDPYEKWTRFMTLISVPKNGLWNLRGEARLGGGRQLVVELCLALFFFRLNTRLSARPETVMRG